MILYFLCSKCVIAHIDFLPSNNIIILYHIQVPLYFYIILYQIQVPLYFYMLILYILICIQYVQLPLYYTVCTVSCSCIYSTVQLLQFTQHVHILHIAVYLYSTCIFRLALQSSSKVPPKQHSTALKIAFRCLLETGTITTSWLSASVQ